MNPPIFARCPFAAAPVACLIGSAMSVSLKSIRIERLGVEERYAGVRHGPYGQSSASGDASVRVRPVQ